MNLSSKGLIESNWLRTLLAPALVVFFLASVPSIAAQSAADNYNHKCAVCHGKDGLGNTAQGKKDHVKDVHANMKDSEDDMIKVVTDGKGDDMDSYKGQFTAAQIKDLVDYYRSLGQK
jgi:mono/diheme cytochrome c family protein